MVVCPALEEGGGNAGSGNTHSNTPAPRLNSAPTPPPRRAKGRTIGTLFPSTPLARPKNSPPSQATNSRPVPIFHPENPVHPVKFQIINRKCESNPPCFAGPPPCFPRTIRSFPPPRSQHPVPRSGVWVGVRGAGLTLAENHSPPISGGGAARRVACRLVGRLAVSGGESFSANLGGCRDRLSTGRGEPPGRRRRSERAGRTRKQSAARTMPSGRGPALFRDCVSAARATSRDRPRRGRR